MTQKLLEFTVGNSLDYWKQLGVPDPQGPLIWLEAHVCGMWIFSRSSFSHLFMTFTHRLSGMKSLFDLDVDLLCPLKLTKAFLNINILSYYYHHHHYCCCCFLLSFWSILHNGATFFIIMGPLDEWLVCHFCVSEIAKSIYEYSGHFVSLCMLVLSLVLKQRINCISISWIN